MGDVSGQRRAELPKFRMCLAPCAAAALICGLASAAENSLASVSISPGAWTGRAFRLRDQERNEDVGHALLAFPHGPDWKLASRGPTEFDARIWTREDQGSGVEMFARRGGGEEKRVVLREGDELNSAAWYSLAPKRGVASTKSRSDRPREIEDSGALLFDEDGWAGVSKCHDDGDEAGRVCETVTPTLCARLQSDRFVIGESELESVQKAEVRAISLALALRGPDHQLDNLIRFGNRMGLKDAAQTTKGRLLQIASDPGFPRQLRALCAEAAGDRLSRSRPDSSIR